MSLSKLAPTLSSISVPDSIIDIDSNLKLADIIIHRRASDKYIDLTEICKAAGVKFAEWFRNNKTKAFLSVLSAAMNIRIEDLIVTSPGVNGKNHKWGHPQVAINLSQWISPEFDVQVSKWIYSLIENGRVLLESADCDRQIESADTSSLITFDDSQPGLFFVIQSHIASFKRHITLSDFIDKPVVYIAYIGYYDGKYYFKFGESSRFQTRINGHSNEFDEIEYIEIIECRNAVFTEGRLKEYICKLGILTSREFKGKNRTELFTPFSSEQLTCILDHLKYIIVVDKQCANMPNIKELEYQLEISNQSKQILQYELKDKNAEISILLQIKEKYESSQGEKQQENDIRLEEILQEKSDLELKLEEILQEKCNIETNYEEENQSLKNKLNEQDKKLKEFKDEVTSLKKLIPKKQIPVGSKKCTGQHGCMQVKPFSSFNIDSHTPSGYCFMCRACSIIYRANLRR